MAALRRLVGHNPNLSYTSLLPPTVLICSRGIASKLFVGGTLSLSLSLSSELFVSLCFTTLYYLKTLSSYYPLFMCDRKPIVCFAVYQRHHLVLDYLNYDHNLFDVIPIWVFLRFLLSPFSTKCSFNSSITKWGFQRELNGLVGTIEILKYNHVRGSDLN